MTTSAEKQCVIVGLQRISDDVALFSAKAEEDLTLSGSSSSSDGEDVFSSFSKTTVIVPALGPDMGEFYADGQIKLLTLNVRAWDFS
jgi:hypothetical protein